MTETVVDQINAALELARFAVDSDAQQDYGVAIRKYRETIRAMETVKDRISQDGARALLSEKLDKYRERLSLLEGLYPSLSANPTVGGPPARGPPARPPPVQPPTTQPSFTSFSPTTTPTQPPSVTSPALTPSPAPPAGSATSSGTVAPWNRNPGLAAPPPLSPTTALTFIEEEINVPVNKSLEPPDSPNQRTFWLVSLLHQSMTTGGYLTPKLYVSTYVWDQKGAKISAVQTKISCLQSVLEGLCRFANVDVNNVDEGAKQLEEFCGVLNGAQNMLAKHLSFIKETRDAKKGIFKTVGTGMARLTAGASNDDSYVVVLRETLGKALLFEKWLAKHENGNRQVWELLTRVCDFFYAVIISFVIRDFNTLLVRYMKRCNESFFAD